MEHLTRLPGKSVRIWPESGFWMFVLLCLVLSSCISPSQRPRYCLRARNYVVHRVSVRAWERFGARARGNRVDLREQAAKPGRKAALSPLNRHVPHARRLLPGADQARLAAQHPHPGRGRPQGAGGATGQPTQHVQLPRVHGRVREAGRAGLGLLCHRAPGPGQAVVLQEPAEGSDRTQGDQREFRR